MSLFRKEAPARGCGQRSPLSLLFQEPEGAEDERNTQLLVFSIQECGPCANVAPSSSFCLGGTRCDISKGAMFVQLMSKFVQRNALNKINEECTEGMWASHMVC